MKRTKREKYISVFQDYKKENCKKDGEQRLNFTFSQRKGFSKLRKRIKSGEIKVMLTDCTCHGERGEGACCQSGMYSNALQPELLIILLIPMMKS